MSTKKVTIKDIAKVLGVTPMTISKALNDHPKYTMAKHFRSGCKGLLAVCI